jgi:sortase A
VTAVDDRPVAEDAPPIGREPVRAPAAERRPQGGIGAAAGWSVVLLAAVLLGFGCYLFVLSGAQEGRAQTTLYKTFRNELALAVAPTGPTTPGAPVAVLDIPQIGLRNCVVVEGTSGGALTQGPGHRVDSALPGQAGLAVLYGRSVTYGAPFAHLNKLRIGDRFTVTTGNGAAKFRVTGFGSDPVPTNGMVLSTAAGEWQPNSTWTVIAELTSTPSMPPVRGALPEADRALQPDPDAVLPLMLWSLVLAAVAIVATTARHRWSPWPTYVCASPIALAVLWNVYENAAQLLPNLY